MSMFTFDINPIVLTPTLSVDNIRAPFEGTISSRTSMGTVLVVLNDLEVGSISPATAVSVNVIRHVSFGTVSSTPAFGASAAAVPRFTRTLGAVSSASEISVSLLRRALAAGGTISSNTNIAALTEVVQHLDIEAESMSSDTTVSLSRVGRSLDVGTIKARPSLRFFGESPGVQAA